MSTLITRTMYLPTNNAQNAQYFPTRFHVQSINYCLYKMNLESNYLVVIPVKYDFESSAHGKAMEMPAVLW